MLINRGMISNYIAWWFVVCYFSPILNALIVFHHQTLQFLVSNSKCYSSGSCYLSVLGQLYCKMTLLILVLAWQHSSQRLTGWLGEYSICRVDLRASYFSNLRKTNVNVHLWSIQEIWSPGILLSSCNALDANYIWIISWIMFPHSIVCWLLIIEHMEMV